MPAPHYFPHKLLLHRMILQSQALVQVPPMDWFKSATEKLYLLPLKHYTRVLCVNEYIKGGKGSYSKKRRKRNRCRLCGCQCFICAYWVCNPCSITERNCFSTHQTAKSAEERNDYWNSMQYHNSMSLFLMYVFFTLLYSTLYGHSLDNLLITNFFTYIECFTFCAGVGGFFAISLVIC